MFLKRILSQSTQTLIGLGIVVGVLFSVIVSVKYHASGDARFCAACHSMELVHNRWRLSHHKQFACIECHLPNANIVAKIAYKAKAGLHDLIHETLRDYPAAISLSGQGRRIVNGNCLRCHCSTIEKTPMAVQDGDCLKCHRFLVHGQGLDKGGIKVE